MGKNTEFELERKALMSGFDGNECKIYPRLVKTDKNIFLSYTMLLLSGSDVFNDSYFVKSVDGGESFGEREKLDKLEHIESGERRIFSPITEYYSGSLKKWFTFGCEMRYKDDKSPVCVGGVSVSSAGYVLRDVESGRYTGDVRPIPLPYECISAVPHAQIVEYDNGEFLLTLYARRTNDIKPHILAVRYRFEDGELSIVRSGVPLEYDLAKRGLCEPSVARLGDRYYLTLRTDEQGMLSDSSDGMEYSEPIPWRWDDGSVLENYNTMQRWIRRDGGLYLAYTRRGANNDHVFRHRAPIFMAKFDPERRCLVRDTEVILVPELGARLGNFTVTQISEDEAWLLSAEWMQPAGCEKYGSNNSVWIAKIRFKQ